MLRLSWGVAQAEDEAQGAERGPERDAARYPPVPPLRPREVGAVRFRPAVEAPDQDEADSRQWKLTVRPSRLWAGDAEARLHRGSVSRLPAT